MLSTTARSFAFSLAARSAFTGTRYAKSHEYITAEGNGIARVGISDYAQKALGDLVFVELPAAGAKKKQGVCIKSFFFFSLVLYCFLLLIMGGLCVCVCVF